MQNIEKKNESQKNEQSQQCNNSELFCSDPIVGGFTKQQIINSIALSRKFVLEQMQQEGIILKNENQDLKNYLEKKMKDLYKKSQNFQKNDNTNLNKNKKQSEQFI